MQIDKQLLENAAKLPQKELEQLIYSVVTAAGGSRFQARTACANTEKLKKKLSELTEEDVKTLIGNLDRGQLEKILAIVREKGLGNHG